MSPRKKKLKQTKLTHHKKRRKNNALRTVAHVNRDARKHISEELSYSNMCHLIDYFAEGLTLVTTDVIRQNKSTRFGTQLVAKCVVKTFKECGYITKQLNNCMFDEMLNGDGIRGGPDVAPTLEAAVKRLIGGLGEGVLRDGELEGLKHDMQETVTRRMQADEVLAWSIIQYYEFENPE
jgi:hypothetical protein